MGMRNNPYQQRFIERKIEICIDGRKEVWELEDISVEKTKMFVTYKLKEHSKYKMGV